MVSPSSPVPPDWGFGIRVYNLARELSRRHHVSLLAYEEPGRDGADPRLRSAFQAVHLVPPPRPAGGKRGAQLRSVVSPGSHEVASRTSTVMQEALDRHLSTDKFDVVQVESSMMAGHRYRTGAVLVLDEHNVEFELLRRSARLEGSPARRLFKSLEAAKMRRQEKAAWSRFDGCVFTSDVDRAVFGAFTGEPGCVVPNAVDLDYFRPPGALETSREADEIVFTGTMNYRPNADGAVYFAESILPLIRRRRPLTRFTVVGQGAPGAVARLAGDGVQVAGRVPDVRPYLARAAVVVVPLRAGSGTRLKVLEALAMARPIVSTSLGCEGLDVEAGRDLLVADEPEGFARHVLRLLDEPAAGRLLGSAGRRLVESAYGWPAAAQVLESFHGRLLEARAEAAR